MISSLPALLFGLLASPVLALPAAVVREVVTPPITYPTASTVWTVGENTHVDWDTSSLPPYPNITNNAGMIVLGYEDACDPAGGEHLDLDHPLAKGFNITAGTIPVTVPKVVPRGDYILVLFGDSGNQSPKFTINVAISGGNSASALPVSTACAASSLASSTAPVTSSSATRASATSSAFSAPTTATSSPAAATTAIVPTPVPSTTGTVTGRITSTAMETTSAYSLPPSVTTFSVGGGPASGSAASAPASVPAISPVRSGTSPSSTQSTPAATGAARRASLDWRMTVALGAVAVLAVAF